MTTVNYPSPITVNGYSCKNCTDVDYAKQHIDPQHPKDGPFGVNAKDHAPSTLTPKPVSAGDAASADRAPAVTFGGALAGASPGPAPGAQPSVPAQRLDILA
ncbi:MAG TPA: hypothetical protein VNW53_11300 [Phenylobacterium sp.]|jgi:hypothetical protein|uniref:hypothetical protein n=1 Tax=Phenylobacterium sp. TaxID=1871053 RepID=UPI002D19D70C|nr:hypothetical protein [Phenylobacterium sp.]HXA39578.1 hypothetical protein [Phenylobacterium sp.]